MSVRIRGAWLFADETRRVIAALEAAGAQARFVGGCVRDALLDRKVTDIDIAVDILPDQVMEALKRAGEDAIPTGIEHGTVTAVIDNCRFEVTTLRSDVATDGRHARVAFGASWADDARRRDLTINALYAEPDGTVVDPLGGLADVRAGHVRFIGNARRRIEEDYLRILRFFRFHAWYGDGAMDPEGLVACAGLAHGIDRVSRNRLGAEMMKLLAAPDPSLPVRMMAETGVLLPVLAEARTDAPLGALISLERRLRLLPDPIRRLAHLTRGADPNDAARALRLSRRIAHALEKRRSPTEALSDDAAARRLGYWRGEDAARDVVLIVAADSGETDIGLLTRQIRATGDGAQRKFPVTATDLMVIGIPPGPELGAMLESIEQLWIDSEFVLDKEALLAKIDARKRRAV